MHATLTLLVSAIACISRNCFAAPPKHAAAAAFTPGQPSSPAPQPSDTTTEIAYPYTQSDLLSAITAEFVFNVAGDHILFPVPAPLDDAQLHATAAAVAETFQKLHVCGRVYRILNGTAHDVVGPANPVKRVLDEAVAKFADDPPLEREYVDAKRRLQNQIARLPAEHGRYASNGTRTMYDVSAEQLVRAERLLDDVRVKKLIMAVTFWKANEYEYESMPRRVRDDVTLARAVFTLADDEKLRERLQRAFDETLAENVERYDVMGSGDDQVVFEALKKKIEKDATLLSAFNALRMR